MAGQDASKLHDPGGRVKLALPEGVTGDAEFSDCGRYRQSLFRDWTPSNQTPRTILFVGQNPSVADVAISDPTCHKELFFARKWGFTRYLKGNILDWRATSPKDVPSELDLARSPENLPVLLDMAAQSETVVLAYGKLHKRFASIVNDTVAALRATEKPLLCLGVNLDGSAKHPLYLRNDTEPMRFPEA